MQVILLKDVAGVGKRGQVVTVNDGYGNNFLIRKGLASQATKEVQEKVMRQSKEIEEKKAKAVEQAVRLKGDIEKRTFSIPVKVGGNGKIFGAVREKDIAEAISSKLNTTIDKTAVSIPVPIKELGQFSAELTLTRGVIATVLINVVLARSNVKI
jgi:large subunit ribosomal protein L9